MSGNRWAQGIVSGLSFLEYGSVSTLFCIPTNLLGQRQRVHEDVHLSESQCRNVGTNGNSTTITRKFVAIAKLARLFLERAPLQVFFLGPLAPVFPPEIHSLRKRGFLRVDRGGPSDPRYDRMQAFRVQFDER